MSDHFSGPRALAGPAGDICDVYAFPSPERPGHLALVMNVLPLATPASLLLGRDRLPLPAATADDRGRQTGVPFGRGGARSSSSPAPSRRRDRARRRKASAGRLCIAPSGETVRFRVNDERGGRGDGLRVYAGLRSDPFFIDLPAYLESIKTGRLAFKNAGTEQPRPASTPWASSSRSTARAAPRNGGPPLFGVVGETVVAGKLPIRLERFGRPEIKNVIMSMKQFDQVNRDLEIRDLYNLEDAFHMSKDYRGAYRARLNANLAAIDRLDGKTDWPLGPDGTHPLTDLLLADYLVVDVSKPFAENSFFEIERAVLEGRPHETCGGRSLNDDVMDTLYTLLINAGNGPRISDGVHQATVPASDVFPYLAPPNPSVPTTPQAGRPAVERASRPTPNPTVGCGHERIDGHAGARRHPGRGSAPSPHPLRRHRHSRAHRRPARRPGAAAPPHPDLVPSAPARWTRSAKAWAAVALSFQGLKALGVPRTTLASFPQEFRQGMAARADRLGDTGESAPEHWEPPLGRPDVHLAIYALAPDAARLEAALAGARDALRELPGVAPIWQQDTLHAADERTSFGFKDGISHPAIEGSGIPGSNPHEEPLKAGEFVLGYPNETGDLPPMPQPEVLGRNGSYVVFRKLHTRVAAFRQYLRARAKSRAEEELLAAKFVGRWPSGAPLVLAPERDDPELGADPARNNAFLYVRGRRARPQVPARRPRPSDERTRRERSSACAACTG